ncbi:MAG: hypothetical protein SPI30_05665 [Prevotella sp.]|nr:hypothetical protein [Prevotella sp.]
MHICKSYIFHHHKAFSEYGTGRSCHRTTVWYSCYQALVRTVPIIGTRRTNDWYQFNPNQSLGRLILHYSLMLLLPDCFRSFVGITSVVFLGVALYAFGKTAIHLPDIRTKSARSLMAELGSIQYRPYD